MQRNPNLFGEMHNEDAARACDWNAELMRTVRPIESLAGWEQAENSFYALSDPRQRSFSGQIMTPPATALVMAAWLAERSPATVLDPAVGLGVFPWALAQCPGFRARVTALDIDPRMIASADYLLRGINDKVQLELRRQDFLSWTSDDKFDAVIANPPYVRHHTAKLKPSVFDRYSRIIGARLSRLTNTYGLFLIEICQRLKPQGRAAVITPSEYLNADFGIPIKRFLIERGYLWGLVLFDHNTELFSNALTTSAIALLENQGKPVESIRVFRVRCEAGLDKLRRDLLEEGTTPSSLRVPAEALNAHDKWYHIGLNSDVPGHWTALGTYAKCSRGIATGANGYFVLSQADALAHRIPHTSLRPCVSKSCDVPSTTFTEHDLQRLIARERRILLLDVSPRDEGDRWVREYLRRGREQGIHERFLPRHRRPWYRMERREPAAIWVNVFARGGFRFVRNDTRALNLTTFHCVYPDGLPDGVAVDTLMAYLVSPLCVTAAQEQVRVYGAGLKKLEPRDVLRLRVPRFEAVGDEGCKIMAAWFQDYAHGVMSRRDLGERLESLLARLCGTQ